MSRGIKGIILTAGIVTAMFGLAAPAGAQTVDCTAPLLPNQDLARGVVGKPYSAQIAVNQLAGGTPPYTFSLVEGSPPLALTMDSSGLVSGTPLVAGRTGFTVQVVDSGSPPLCGTGGVTIEVINDPTLDSLVAYVERGLRCTLPTIGALLGQGPPSC